jgi:Zn finger protein HypA/HybF involved in hydrogenase expression
MRIDPEFAEFACECDYCGAKFLSMEPDTICRECEGEE